MKKKPAITVTAILAALAVAVAVLAALGGQNTAEKRRLLEGAEFVVVSGEEKYRVTMEEFLALEQREIEANYKKSGREPETRYYTGVPFAKVLAMKGIGLTGVETAVFSAADGYVSPLPAADALNEENCFIVADSGGEGPFRMILARDPFSQRWCKLLIEVELK
jgi:hypothetical protein